MTYREPTVNDAVSVMRAFFTHSAQRDDAYDQLSQSARALAFHLYGQGPGTICSIALHGRISVHAASRAAHALVRAGLGQYGAVKGDRRMRTVCLTPAGRRMVESMARLALRAWRAHGLAVKAGAAPDSWVARFTKK